MDPARKENGQIVAVNSIYCTFNKTQNRRTRIFRRMSTGSYGLVDVKQSVDASKWQTVPESAHNIEDWNSLNSERRW